MLAKLPVEDKTPSTLAKRIMKPSATSAAPVIDFRVFVDGCRDSMVGS
jgi:hypothetical protein